MRNLLPVLLAMVIVSTVAAPVRADQILGQPRIDTSNRVQLPGGPALGTWQAGKYTAKPDALQIQGAGSTGDVSGMSAKSAAVGAIMRAISDRLADEPTVKDFGAVSDPTCAIDNTAAIQAAINANPGRLIRIPLGSYCFSSINITASGTGLDAVPGTRLLMSNAASNGIVVGDGTNIIDSVHLRGFTMWTKPGLTKTGGHAILIQKGRNFGLMDLNVGSKKELSADSGIPRLYNGVVIVGFDNGAVRSTNIVGATNDCFTIAGSGSGKFGSEFAWEGGGQIVQCGHFGAKLAGGTGGVKFMSGGIALSTYGMWTSTDLDNALNRETYLGAQFSVDSNTVEGLHADPDTLGFLFCEGCWIASNGSTGANIRAQAAGSIVRFDTPHIYNNGADGLASVGNVKVVGGTFFGNGRTSPGSGINVGGGTASIDGGAFLNGNGIGSRTGYGIVASGGSVRLGTYEARGNQSGSLSAAAGILAPATAGTLQAPNYRAAGNLASTWALDGGDASISLAQGASLVIAPGSGLVLLNESKTGSTAAFIIGGGSVALLGQAGAAFVASSKPVTGKIGVYWSGSSYIIGNNSGATVTLGNVGMRVRPGN